MPKVGKKKFKYTKAGKKAAKKYAKKTGKKVSYSKKKKFKENFPLKDHLRVNKYLMVIKKL